MNDERSCESRLGLIRKYLEPPNSRLSFNYGEANRDSKACVTWTFVGSDEVVRRLNR
ncbi:hypothetical protein J1N35_010124 [Gossypium stocksii]|uniref:Uncharacterized protein n=1 Tax=Gossypium stocksii TaxID=47602 RepID=A0A9D3VZC5_9ROSI|nr:hypothetical protein J1N35_010124 [Gossypium stocksii]